MSQAFPSSSMPLDASQPGTPRSRLLDPIRGTVRLLWIEFRRCGGYWILPLIFPLVWFVNQGRDSYGVVLWFRMSIVTFQSYVIIGPLTAGLTAFLAGRDRRRRMDGLIATAPVGPFRRDLLMLAVGAAWGLVAYALVGTWYLGQAVLFATWGGPDLTWLAVGALAIVVHAALGLLVGRVIRGRFAALVAVALPIAFAIGVDSYRRITEVDLGGDIGMVTNYEQPLRELSPFSLVMSLGYNDDGILNIGNTYARDSSFWLIGLLGVILAAIAFTRHRRSLVGMAGLGPSLVVATVGAYSLLDDGDPDAYVESRLLPFEWSCQTGAAIEVCVHPAYEARLDEVVEQLTEMLQPVAGLPGVPTTWRQSMPVEGHDDQNPGGIGAIHNLNSFVIAQSVADEVFLHDRDGNYTAVQLVVIAALAEQAGLEDQGPQFYGWPAEAMTVGSDGFHMPDESKMAALQTEMDVAVDRFLALSPEQQRAWLEANWDALRAGELTLDDMP